ncbi:MAG TPA: helicase, partial [Chloroflexi bacterium]|nr:helicase [Chloroflexota bacterium]
MPIIDRIESARRELLDLTTRSRLLHTPRGASVKIVEVVDERSEQIYRILVQEGKRMSFLPQPESEGGLAAGDSAVQMELLAPEDDGVEEERVAGRHIDTRLQAKLTSARLQKRLLQLYYDARNFEEEQGVNILYLALGFLKWFEAPSSDRPRYAPLILVPVVLDRRSAQSRFQLRYSEEELSTNLSLQAKLKLDFGIELPELPDAEELSPSPYYDAVAKVVSAQPRWELLRDDIVLGFFSFAKFLMYRDLDPRSWPQRRKLEEHPMIHSLLGDGFNHDPSPFSEDTNVDEVLEPGDMVHVVDADSSQTLAIEEVRRGRSLVIQGPPGTGKSQTIANLIAMAVREGKTVLFMAEKMAALEVVQRRLDRIGLAVMCLALHSHKARKKAVLEELERTLNLGRPQVDGIETLTDQLRERREQLNAHVRRLHTPLEASGFTPYQIAGHLVRLSAKGVPAQDYKLDPARTWSREDLRERETQIQRVAQHIEEMGTPGQHPWRGARLDVVLPQDVARLEPRIHELLTRLAEWRAGVLDLGRCLDVPAETWKEVAALLRLADAIAQSPSMDRASIASPAWEARRETISALVEALRR